MMFNVPQYVDVEDKVAGPLTAKQLFWMIGMGAALLVLWNIFPQNVFIVIAIPVVIVFVAMAFYRPYGMPLVNFVGHSLFFLIRPKIYVWNRPHTPTIVPQKQKIEAESAPQAKEMTPEQISELSQILNQRGR